MPLRTFWATIATQMRSASRTALSSLPMSSAVRGRRCRDDCFAGSAARCGTLFLLAFALTIALGVRFLGVLLMGSLIIIPAATARHLARNLTGMLVISIAVAVLSTISGTYVAALFHHQTGPFIITIAGGIFFLSLLI